MNCSFGRSVNFLICLHFVLIAFTVNSFDTLVNSDVASNEIISNPFGSRILDILCLNSLASFTVLCDLPTTFFKMFPYILKGCKWELLKVDWHGELSHLGVDDAVDKFYCILGSFVDTIPKNYVTARDYPVYFSLELVR